MGKIAGVEAPPPHTGKHTGQCYLTEKYEEGKRRRGKCERKRREEKTKRKSKLKG
jgi:hypothetical protein